MKHIFASFVALFLLATSVVLPAKAEAAAYSVYSPSSPVSITCEVTDSSCEYNENIVFVNSSGKMLFQTSFWTSGSNIQYLSSSAGYTSATTQIEWPSVIEPNNTIATFVKVTNPKVVGTYTSRLYIDGKVCNQNVTPWDCYFYGGNSFDVTMHVVNSSTPSPSPSMSPTPSPSVSPSPAPSESPVVSPSPSPSPSVSPTPSPSVSPSPSISPSPSASSNTEDNGTGGTSEESGDSSTTASDTQSNTESSQTDQGTTQENTNSKSLLSTLMTKAKLAFTTPEVTATTNEPSKEMVSVTSNDSQEKVSKLNPVIFLVFLLLITASTLVLYLFRANKLGKLATYVAKLQNKLKKS